MIAIDISQLLDRGGDQPSEAQQALLRAHQASYHQRAHEVEAEIRAQLLFWAPILCSCTAEYRKLSMIAPPMTAGCIIHGQAQNLLGDRPECDHDG